MNHSTPTPYFPENLEEYPQWVQKYGLFAPYGICQCGCGQPTRVSRGYTRTEEFYAKGDFHRYCSGHSLQAPWYENLEEYFWTYCTPGPFTDCWEWQGSIGDKGYGVIFFRGKEYKAHRVSWEIHNAQPFPPKTVGCHSCDNPPCVNPYHIWPGTRRDNVDDMMSKQRQARGETGSHAKLTEEQVREIRKLCSEGNMQKDVAKQFGVKPGAIYCIVHRRSWSHIP